MKSTNLAIGSFRPSCGEWTWRSWMGRMACWSSSGLSTLWTTGSYEGWCWFNLIQVCWSQFQMANFPGFCWGKHHFGWAKARFLLLKPTCQIISAGYHHFSSPLLVTSWFQLVKSSFQPVESPFWLKFQSSTLKSLHSSFQMWEGPASVMFVDVLYDPTRLDTVYPCISTSIQEVC